MRIITTSAGAQEDAGFLSRLSFFLKEVRHDHQWLLLVGFLALIGIGGYIIDSATLLPGYTTTSMLDGGESVIDVEWSDSGDFALVITEDSEGISSLSKWEGGDLTLMSTGVEFPLAVEQVAGGFLVGGTHGYFVGCEGECDSFSEVSTIWADGMNEVSDIVGITSVNGDDGVLLTRPRFGQETIEVRSFGEGVVTNASTPISPTHRITSTEMVLGGSVIAIGFDESVSNPTLGDAGEVFIEVTIMGESEPPRLDLIHYSGSGRPHTLLVPAEDTVGSDVIAIISGITHSHILYSDFSIEMVEGHNGASAAAIDSFGTVWFTAPDASGQVSWFEPSSGEIEKKGVCESCGMQGVVGVTVGDEVRFYGDSTLGTSTIEATIDPLARDDLFSSPTKQGAAIYLSMALIVTVVVGWTFWENRGEGSW